jgi:hypothetical protein
MPLTSRSQLSGLCPTLIAHAPLKRLNMSADVVCLPQEKMTA